MDTGTYDVIVAGGGGAAIRAAIAAYETNTKLKVALISKGKFGKSGVTATACSDRMAFHATLPHTEPAGGEAWKHHADDIYRIGGYVSDYDLAVILAKNSKDAFDYLDEIGVPFAKKDGLPVQFLTDGSRYARACFTGPYTAVDIEKALVEKIKSLPVDIIEHTMITDAIVEKGCIKGVCALDENGNELVFACKALVLGTGGAGAVYKNHVFTNDSTGDGYAIALRAGAKLVNMEFIQLGLASAKTKLACSGSLMRAVPRYIDENGREFLQDSLPHGMTPDEINNVIFLKGQSWPLSNEDVSHILDVAVFRHIMKGHRVFLDYSKNNIGFKYINLSESSKALYEKEAAASDFTGERDKSPLERLKEINPMSIAWLKKHGIDLEQGEFVEIIPSAQHYQGGVKIKEDASTDIQGLYAAGECAGGQHGANRPGGNALLDCQVFGKIAGESGAKYASLHSGSKAPNLHEGMDYFKNICLAVQKGIPAEKARNEIQSLMSRYGSVIRTGEGLGAALKRAYEIKECGIVAGSKGIYYYAETLNIIDTAIALLEAMRMRKESRGPHLFFESETDIRQLTRNDEDYRNYFVISQTESGINVHQCNPIEPNTKHSLKS